MLSVGSAVTAPGLPVGKADLRPEVACGSQDPPPKGRMTTHLGSRGVGAEREGQGAGCIDSTRSEKMESVDRRFDLGTEIESKAAETSSPEAIPGDPDSSKDPL